MIFIHEIVWKKVVYFLLNIKLKPNLSEVTPLYPTCCFMVPFAIGIFFCKKRASPIVCRIHRAEFKIMFEKR